MELAADAGDLFLERGAFLARQHPRIFQQPVPGTGTVGLVIDPAFDPGDAIANLFARTNLIRGSYHLNIAAATNAMIIKMPNSMCNCTERSNARFSFFASVSLRTIRI